MNSRFSGFWHFRHAASVLVTGLLLLPTLAAAGEQPAAEAGHPELSLFDGETLAGWTVENGAKAEVVDGTLKLVDGDGWLRTDHTYTDFRLHLEWMALGEDGYDAGIYIRTQEGGAPFPKDGWQINLLKGKEGWLGRLKAEHKLPVNPPREWNTFDITVVGDTVTLDVNGKRAYSVSGLKSPAGYVGLQCEVPLGGQFQFRNIR
ncbi:MAG: DUF1080 domain-containing protein, partial [Planctomycetaceae bacterium]|nr:DUF1080 domain-containing protein [Planctomycetaceae bacterium]